MTLIEYMRVVVIIIICLVSCRLSAQVQLDTTKTFQENYDELYHPWMRFGTFIPQNMDECMLILESDIRYEEVLTYKEDEIYMKLFGDSPLAIRQNWDLKCHSALAEYFYSRGIYSFDKMNGTILLCYYKLSKTGDYDFEQTIRVVAKAYEYSEKLTYKLLKSEFKGEKRLHKKIVQKSKKEHKKVMKMQKKGAEFDDFFK